MRQEIVIADDSGLQSMLSVAHQESILRASGGRPHLAENNTSDEDNNARLIRELKSVPLEERSGRFVCVDRRGSRWRDTHCVSWQGRGHDPRHSAW